MLPKKYPLETRKFYDATLEVYSRRKINIQEIKEELQEIRGNGFMQAVLGVELALEKLAFIKSNRTIRRFR